MQSSKERFGRAAGAFCAKETGLCIDARAVVIGREGGKSAIGLFMRTWTIFRERRLSSEERSKERGGEAVEEKICGIRRRFLESDKKRLS